MRYSQYFMRILINLKIQKQKTNKITWNVLKELRFKKTNNITLTFMSMSSEGHKNSQILGFFARIIYPIPQAKYSFAILAKNMSCSRVWYYLKYGFQKVCGTFFLEWKNPRKKCSLILEKHWGVVQRNHPAPTFLYYQHLILHGSFAVVMEEHR